MKKLLLFAIIVGGSIAFTSCSKKECTCTVGGASESFTEDDLPSGSASVEEYCDASDAAYKALGIDGSCSMN
ncbi:MAG: hypothetical protein CO118_11845 [Flavobacteriales bacterium CG_4_9_14_3_um_filter_32_8]|nr:MAG: hypothetical protein CO118_11845 [Flavobacteriales bacterium CG_4_9_14_3_um_filter_32_8]